MTKPSLSEEAMNRKLLKQCSECLTMKNIHTGYVCVRCAQEQQSGFRQLQELLRTIERHERMKKRMKIIEDCKVAVSYALDEPEKIERVHKAIDAIAEERS